MKIAIVAAFALVASSAWAQATKTPVAPPAATPATPAPAATPTEPPQAAPKSAQAASTDPVFVIMSTTRGDIVLELFPAQAPISVENFLKYVDSGFYNGTMFHRSMPNFVIQGGGFDATFTQKKPRDPIKNEANNGLANKRGSISMARTEAPDSATSQFFLNLKDNRQLDRNDFSAGYAVFGQIVRGEDVMDAIAKIPTDKKPAVTLHGQNLMSDVPTETVTITTARRATREEATTPAAPPADAAPTTPSTPPTAPPANPPAGAPAGKPAGNVSR